jgi:hypothetical protein
VIVCGLAAILFSNFDFLFSSVGSLQEQTPQGTFLRGTIVSVRAGLLIVKPMLRPKLTRVAVVESTMITAVERTRAPLVKAGWHVGYVGQIMGADFRYGFMAVAPTEIGLMKDLPFGGVVKSAQPFIVTDRQGKDVRLQIGEGVEVERLYKAQKNSLLIGSMIDVFGQVQPDEVLQAQSIQPESAYAEQGTMFGRVEKLNGNRLTLIPRFTKDKVTVDLLPGAGVQRERRLDPDTIKVGTPVTVWGLYSGDPHPAKDRQGLLAIAMTLGSGAYPRSKAASGGAVVKGTIESLVPNVVVRTKEGKRIPIVVPAQLIISRLTRAGRSEVKPGAEAMFVLKPKPGGGFEASAVVLNASPWVGYGN